ncbi:GTP-binding protein [Frigoribacterium sp. 2-23]|uniref:GTP-binding protein n=1 Tax=Frigoribacterium sp. 2-23 TaxID=3415006 RepID=UPI003C6FB945
MAEHVILFAGPMGAGKTTAIETLSETAVVRTEAANTDRETADKDTTTVALDYGEITLAADEKVRLYGVPGQQRFDFMWTILKERAEGMVLLVNNDAADPIGEMLHFLDEFRDLYDKGGVIVAATRSDVASTPSVADYSAALSERRPDLIVPVFTVDPREESQMRTVLMTLVANIEMRSMFAVANPTAAASASAPARDGVSA